LHFSQLHTHFVAAEKLSKGLSAQQAII
jgi:hypothetical protein